MFKKRLSGRGMGFLLATFVAAGLAAAGFMQTAPASGSALQAPATSVAKGGRLYDKWWTEAGVSVPVLNQNLWATQTTNTRTGEDTWRCKECHAWDYLGKDGAYGSGSHKTGFVGVSDAGKNKTAEQLTAIMKGSTNPNHNFSAVLSDALIGDLANFLKEGLIDVRQYIDYATKKPKQAVVAHGKELFSTVCAACHGADGTLLNFGSAAEPEYVGTVASDNPQEVLHKIRVGQSGTAMPSAFVNGWSVQDMVDVLAYAQTLPTTTPASAISVAKGGRLYDKWWMEGGLTAPAGNQPLWATQTTNTRTGLDTWRCKECHAWDYLGKDGAYGSGSHKTGFAGVSDAGKNKTAEQLTAMMKGSTNPSHNFSAVLSDARIADLVNFLKEGLIDDRQYIDYATKKPKQADVAHGKELFSTVCAACHGADGTQLNFGSAAEPEYVGTVASDNPQEVLHKIRVGQPGTVMPSAFVNGWSVQDMVDVLAYAQTLPTGAPAPAPATPAAAPAALPKTGDAVQPQAVIPGALVLSLLLIGAGLGLRRLITRA